jgi:site-specific DNA-cytosine methylase
MKIYLDFFSGIGGLALSAHWAGMRFDRHYFSEIDPFNSGNPWQLEWPDTPRISSKIPSRVDRLKGIGNSVVPQIPQLIWEGVKEDFYVD